MKTAFPTKIYTIFTVLIIGLALAYYFGYSKIIENNKKAEEYAAQFDTETNKERELSILNNSIDSIKEDRARLNTHFAYSSDVVPFLNTVESLATKVGVKAETSSVDVVEGEASLSVRVKASGSFANIYKYLTLLENSEYLIEINGFTMERVETAAVEVTLPPETTSETGELGTEPITQPLPSVPREAKWDATFDLKLLSFIK